MAAEFPSKQPFLHDDIYQRFIKKSNHNFNFWLRTEKDTQMAFALVDSARKIAPTVCSLPENEGKKGFALVITKASVFPSCVVQIGVVEEPDPLYGKDGKLGKYVVFAGLKAEILKKYPEFISSSQNLTLPEDEQIRSYQDQVIPGGALKINDWIISVSAFKNARMDTATALEIALDATLITPIEAVRISRDPRVNCLSEFTPLFHDYTQRSIMSNRNR